MKEFLGRIMKRIWLEYVNCVGNETLISQCPKRQWGFNDCHHGEDAGVNCSKLLYIFDILLISWQHNVYIYVYINI